jgi:hypothetical protein
MQNGRIKVWLSPLNGGSYTQLRLTGSAPTALSKRVLRRFAERMSFWSGAPVECALSVDKETAAWCEWWTERLAAIPGRLLEVRFVARGQKRKIGGNSR